MLRGERVRLRGLEPSDEQVIWEWHQDHEFHVLDGWIYPASHKQIAMMIEHAAEPGFRNAWFGIETEKGTLIGHVNLKRGHPEHQHADLGIAIERNYWDRGYGTDAVRTLLRFPFRKWDSIGRHLVMLTTTLGQRRSI